MFPRGYETKLGHVDVFNGREEPCCHSLQEKYKLMQNCAKL
jgi:hypothetical protein